MNQEPTLQKPMDRLSIFIEFIQTNPRSFERSINISNGYFAKQKKNGSIGSNILEKIHHHYKILDIKWLLTGEGHMLNRKNVVIEKDPEIDLIKNKILLIERNLEGISTQMNLSKAV
jgi:hypothetical protein